MKSDKKTFTLIAGGPGSGKSTLVKACSVEIASSLNLVRINADEIREQIPEYRRMSKSSHDGQFFAAVSFVQREVYMLAETILAVAVTKGKDILFVGFWEWDSAYEIFSEKIGALRDAGYAINAIYLTVPTELAWERNVNRSMGKDRRYIPKEILFSNHAEISRNYPLAVADGLFDKVSLLDMTKKKPKLIGTNSGGVNKSKDIDLYDSILKKIL